MFAQQSGGGGKRSTSREGFDVYVGNLPENTSEDQLRTFFQQYGEVLSVSIRSKESSYFAFIRYATEDECTEAIRNSGVNFNGTKVIIRKGFKKAIKREKDGEATPSFGMGNKPDLVSNHQALPKGNGPAPGSYRPHGPKTDNKAAFQVERREQLVVSFVESPVAFWAQNCAYTEVISDITMKLQSLCPSVFTPATRPVRDKVYAAKFSEDGCWYRCKILNFPAQNQVQVLYIDYGNTETRLDNDLVDLPPGLQQPLAQAVKYVLYGLNAVHGDPSTHGFLQGQNYLKSLVEQRIVEADLISNVEFSPWTPVVLHADDKDINQLMLDNGHASRKSSSKPQNTGGTYGGGTGGTYGGGRMAPDAQQRGQTKPKFIPANKQHQPHKAKSGEFGMWENPMTTTQAAPGPPMWLATKGSGDFATGGPVVTDSRELESLSQELAISKARLAEASVQAEKQRIRSQQEIDRLTKEQNRLHAEREQLSHQLKDFEKNKFTENLQTLLSDANAVRVLRGQFPTDDSRVDLVENAILLLTQDDPLKGSNIMLFVEDCENSSGSFKVIQDRIRSAQSVEEVGDILEARDNARCELNKKIEDFIEAIEKFPIDNASESFQRMICCLEETYKPYTSGSFDGSCMLTLDQIQAKWNEWKADNSPAIQEVRTDVNTYHNKVDSLLSQLQEQLRISSSDVSNVNLSCSNLQQCITDLQCAVNKEIAMTDLTNKSDGKLHMRQVVRSLVQTCVARLEQLGILKVYRTQYEAVKEKIAPWLHKKPDLQEVQVMRKNIRSCNSKLRHRLADKLDLEEADDTSTEEIQEVKESITQLRNELQEALAKQDELVSNIQDVILNQFPELALEYADLGIKTSVEYSGLVKEGRSLDQFDLEPFDADSKGVYKSTFCGKPVLLKEYLLDDNIGATKTEFLKKVQIYHNAQSCYLLPIEAVFFTKNERQAVVQVPRFQYSLAKKVQDEKLEFEVNQSILRNVAEALAALHKQGLVHGAVNPQNVFLTEDNKAMLNCVDFMKTAEQRMLSGNPQFVAPEVLVGSHANLKSDIYSLGVLAYLLNFPEATPMTEWPYEARDTPLQQLVVQATAKMSSERPDASDLLSFPFFKTRMVVSRDILQLRMKSGSPRSENGGILKNSSPVREHPPPDVIGGGQILNTPVKRVEVADEGQTSDIIDAADTELNESNNGDLKASDGDQDGPHDEDVDQHNSDQHNSTPETLTQDVNGTQDQTPENAVQDDKENDEENAKKFNKQNKVASQVMYNSEGTPTLPCTPMDTPSNTPIESENNTPVKTIGTAANIQASLETLLSKKPVEEVDEENVPDEDDCLPALEDGSVEVAENN